MTKPTLWFAGTPEFAAHSLAALIEAGYAVTGVLTQPDRPAGRGRKLSPSAVKSLALTHQLPIAQPEKLQADALARSGADSARDRSRRQRNGHRHHANGQRLGYRRRVVGKTP